MTVSGLTPWEVKLARAQEHIDELDSEVSAYLRGPNRPRLRSEHRPEEDGESHVVDLRLVLPEHPPARWSTLVGDAIHNVRSALDSRTFGVVLAHATPPLTEGEQRRVVFPITQNRAGFDGTAKKPPNWSAGKVPLAVAEAFAACQPWYDLGTGGERPAVEVALHPLSVLQRLSNVDKHQTLHPTVCLPDLIGVSLPAGVTTGWKVQPLPWTDGTLLATCTVAGPKAEEANFHAEFDVGLAEEVRPLDVPPVVGLLTSILRHVHWLLARLSQQGY